MIINWNDFTDPRKIENLIDDLIYSNYCANRERGMSHESLVRALELSEDKAAYYHAAYHVGERL